jgi:hypothetical protein
MAAVATINLVNAQKILDTWAELQGPSEEEQIEFAKAALEELRDPAQKPQFAENVKEVGTWANEVDAAFDRVTRGFVSLTEKYGAQFPDLSTYLDRWKTYEARWIQYLRDSRDVASTHIAILRRFDKIFLELVESIVTNQDRLDVIKELQQFIDEDHSDSIRLSQNFLNLKRDIEYFVEEFGQWIVDKGVELEAEATRLKLVIQGLQEEIQVLDKKIEDAIIALAVAGALLNIIGLIVACSVLAAFKSQRNGKAADLLRNQAALAEVNQKQEALAHIKTEFDGLRPDIALICNRLVLFSEIWSSVRSQTMQFQEHLKGGEGAETNLRFKLEVRLAREVCLPLMDGLQKYADELENRPARISRLSDSS